MTDDRALLPFDEGDGRLIRRQWHDGRWFFSVVDVVGVLTDSSNPRNYWSMLKRRMRDEGATQLYTECVQLKMRSLDGKSYATDAADVETMFRIVQSMPSPKAEPVKQWLAKAGAEKLEEIAQSDLLSGMTTEQCAIFLRGQVADRNTTLAAAAQNVGVVSGRDFAVFQDWGYRGLYVGETARDIATRKGLARGQKILDWMGPDELAANLFRASLAEQRLRQGDATTKAEANAVHHETGAAVRRVIVEQGATVPEQLPTPAESIQELQRREQKRLEAERQPSVFDELTEA